MAEKVIGIDIGGTNLRGGLVDSRGNILKRMKILDLNKKFKYRNIGMYNRETMAALRAALYRN